VIRWGQGEVGRGKKPNCIAEERGGVKSPELRIRGEMFRGGNIFRGAGRFFVGKRGFQKHKGEELYSEKGEAKKIDGKQDLSRK